MDRDDLVEAPYIIVELTDKGASLNFQHLFDMAITGTYKITLEKVKDKDDGHIR